MMRTLAVLLAVVLALTSCSSFSKTHRQERAFARYLRKSAAVREKQRVARLRTSKPQMPAAPMLSAPLESSETSPQSVPADGGGQ